MDIGGADGGGAAEDGGNQDARDQQKGYKGASPAVFRCLRFSSHLPCPGANDSRPLRQELDVRRLCRAQPVSSETRLSRSALPSGTFAIDPRIKLPVFGQGRQVGMTVRRWFSLMVY